MRVITHPAVHAVFLALLLGISPTAAPAQTAGATPAIADKSAAGELAFWNSIKNSSSAADFKTYLDNFPNGMFYDQALERFKKAGGDAAGLAGQAAAAGKANATPPATTAAVKTQPKTAVAAKPAYHPYKKKAAPAKSTYASLQTAKPGHGKKLVCRGGVIKNGVCLKTPTKKVVRTVSPPNTPWGGGGKDGSWGKSGGGWGG
jgi:hypothetical protein